jgi:hypothetical protein
MTIVMGTVCEGSLREQFAVANKTRSNEDDLFTAEIQKTGTLELIQAEAGGDRRVLCMLV